MNPIGHIANKLLKYPQYQIFPGHLTHVSLYISKTSFSKRNTKETLSIFGYFLQTICYMSNFRIMFLFSKNKKPSPCNRTRELYINNNVNTFAIPPLTVYRILPIHVPFNGRKPATLTPGLLLSISSYIIGDF